MKLKSKTYLKFGILLFGISLFLWNCDKENVIDNSYKTPVKVSAKTVSFQEAKNFFESKQNENQFLKSGNNSIEVTPDWNSLAHNDIQYTDALLTTADANINRNGNYSSQLYFIKVNDEMKNVIFTIWKDKIDENGLVVNARVFFNELDGTFIDAYKIENGKFTKRLIFKKKVIINKAAFFTFIQNGECPGGWNVGELSDDSEEPCINADEVHLGSVPSSGGGGSGGSSVPYIGYFSVVNDAVSAGNNSDPITSGGGGGIGSNSITNTGITSGAAAILTIPPDENGNCPEGFKKDSSGNCVSICVSDKLYDSATKKCICPTGKEENSSGTCVTPCNTSKDDLKKIFTTTSDDKLQKIADAINKYGKNFGIDTKEKLQHFLTQAGHESNKFKAYSEYTNYRVKKLSTIFGKHFNPYDDPKKHESKQNPKDYEVSGSIYANGEKLLNFVYNDANRGKKYKLGNTSTGDGYKYRGRGIFQLTGKSNYKKFTDFYQDKYDNGKDFVTTPGLVATDMNIAVISALWFYESQVDIDINSDTTVKDVTKEVNGGENGLKDRKALHTKAKTNIDCVS